jgi:hypothetical protein
MSEALGVSERTGQRWAAGGFPSYHLVDLARVVHPHDPTLAAEIAEAAGGTLVSLGIVKPAPAAPARPNGSDGPPAGVVDAVVCAAAEAMQLPPHLLRPALLAALVRARELALPVDFVEKTLAASLEPPGRKASKKP